MINTKPVCNIRTLFLRFTSLCYVIAFHSLYIQVPGLYGDNGILPAKSIIIRRDSSSLLSLMSSSPTLLWLQPYSELSVQQMMEMICLLGRNRIFISFVSIEYLDRHLYLLVFSNPFIKVLCCDRHHTGLAHHHVSSVHHQTQHVPSLAPLYVSLPGGTNISSFPVGHSSARDWYVGYHS